MLGTAWTLAQNSGDSTGAPQLPVGQTFKQFEYPIYQDGQAEGHDQRRRRDGHHPQPRAKPSDLNIEIYDPGTTRIRPPSSPRPRPISTSRAKDAHEEHRATSSAPTWRRPRRLRLRSQEQEVCPAHERQGRPQAFRDQHQSATARLPRRPPRNARRACARRLPSPRATMPRCSIHPAPIPIPIPPRCRSPVPITNEIPPSVSFPLRGPAHRLGSAAGADHG